MSVEQETNIGMAAKDVGAEKRGFQVNPMQIVTLAVIAGALVLPFTIKGYLVYQATTVVYLGIAIMGLNLLTGFNGQFSLGHGAFIAVGAYTAAILMDRFEVHYLLTLPAAGFVAFIFGALFGLPALRLQNIYLALATFSLAFVTPTLLKLKPFEDWTGGVQGLYLFKPEVPFGLPLTQDQYLYLLTLAVALLLYVVARNIVKSRTGRAIQAIRDNPIAAKAMGVNTAFYKTMIFGVSAFFAGVAGALAALVTSYVAPDSFTLILSVGLLVGLVIGGVGWLPGAFIGAIFIHILPDIAEEVSKGLSGALYGALLLLVIYVMPNGAGTLWRTAHEYVSRRRK